MMNIMFPQCDCVQSAFSPWSINSSAVTGIYHLHLRSAVKGTQRPGERDDISHSSGMTL